MVGVWNLTSRYMVNLWIWSNNKKGVVQNGHHGNGHPPSESARIKSYLAKLEREGIARVKMFIVITIAYLIFWGPLFLVTLFSYTDYKTEDPSTSHEVSVINFGFLKSSQLWQMKYVKIWQYNLSSFQVRYTKLGRFWPKINTFKGEYRHSAIYVRC